MERCLQSSFHTRTVAVGKAQDVVVAPECRAGAREPSTPTEGVFRRGVRFVRVRIVDLRFDSDGRPQAVLPSIVSSRAHHAPPSKRLLSDFVVLVAVLMPCWSRETPL